MKTGKRIHCCIVRVVNSGAVAVRQHARPRRVADPFIAGLIAKLQAEVREERRSAAKARSVFGDLPRFGGNPQGECAEAEITWSGSPLHFTESDFDSWERRSLPPRER